MNSPRTTAELKGQMGDYVLAVNYHLSYHLSEERACLLTSRVLRNIAVLEHEIEKLPEEIVKKEVNRLAYPPKANT